MPLDPELYLPVPSEVTLYPLDEHYRLTFEELFTDRRRPQFDTYRLYATQGIFDPDPEVVELAVLDVTTRAMGELGLCPVTEHWFGERRHNFNRYNPHGLTLVMRRGDIESLERRRALSPDSVIERIGETTLSEPLARPVITCDCLE